MQQFGLFENVLFEGLSDKAAPQRQDAFAPGKHRWHASKLACSPKKISKKLEVQSHRLLQHIKQHLPQSKVFIKRLTGKNIYIYLCL